MASYTPTTTCNDLATRIADELSRSDLTSQIQKEINSAILHYSGRQLWGTEGSWTSNTTAGTRYYPVAVNFRSIDSAIASYNAGNYQYPIIPKTWDYIASIDFGLANFNSYPQYVAYQANQFRFYPPTLGSGTITIYGQVDQLPLVFNQTTAWAANTTYATSAQVVDSNNGIQQVTAGGGGSSGGSAPTWATTLNSTTTDNALTWTLVGTLENWWTTEAESLVRNRALSQLYAHYIKDPEQAQTYAALEGQSYLRFKKDNISRGVSSHKVTPTQW